MIQARRSFIYLAFFGFVFLLTSGLLLRNRVRDAGPSLEEVHHKNDPPTPKGPKYKPKTAPKALPIVDNFPLAGAAHSAAELPPIPIWSIPPAEHVPERTPLFIGFTRNWRLLQQVVVSYITSGWPASDIYVVENTGVLDANKLGQLSLQNPFFLNHTRLEMLGVNILVTPTLFTFAQLQNYYLYTSTTEKWPYYFWSHMDVVAVPYEFKYAEQHPTTDLSTPLPSYPGFETVYTNCLLALREVLAAASPENATPLRWAMRFFSYDRLALVNVASFREVGGWDTQIPFYMTDCDMHARLEMAQFSIEEKPAGLIYDVASSLDDLIVLYRKTAGPEGMRIPEAGFVDPNILEEELAAAAAEEERLKTAVHINSLTSISPPVKRTPSSSSATSLSTSTPPIKSQKWTPDIPNSPAFAHLMNILDHMQNSKHAASTRNKWQSRQTGGQGDPFYRDSAGFEQAILLTIEHGRNVFREKWGHRDCDIVAVGLRPEDAWRVEKDW